jgi:tetratricopeptide (TPR) repeat protein
MTKTCSSCDVLAPPDARYCRHCGATLQRLNAPGDAGANVSPNANTVPLYGQNPTDEIAAAHADRSHAPHTSEVTHEEMYDAWRRSTSAGGGREGEPERPGDGQFSPVREGRHASPAHPAESLRAELPHGSAQGDYDPEQTQITIPVRPLTSRNLPADAAAASVARRANGNAHFDGLPQQVTLSPTGSLVHASPATATPVPHTPARANERRAFRVWLGMGLAGLSVVVICCVAAALWFSMRSSRRDADAAPPAVAAGEAAPVVDDPKQLAAAKLAEADALLASGNAPEALARLREAVALAPEDAEPHRRLARLLLANGSRREAIEALRVVTRHAPADAEAWRSLASTQFAEGLYRDALESYRGLGEAAPAALARDPVQLAYADTLRLAGRTNDARAIYRRLAETSSDATVAAASKRQLGQPSPTPLDEEADGEEADIRTADAARTAGATTTRDDASRPPDAPSASPTTTTTTTPPATAPSRASSGSPSDQYQRGVALWPTNRAAAVSEFRSAAERGNSDASYYLGLSIAEGRDPRSLKRAELVAAIVHFGRARRGKFRGQSATYEEQLGRELDRRRNDER